jgi:hypothetical protein
MHYSCLIQERRIAGYHLGNRFLQVSANCLFSSSRGLSLRHRGFIAALVSAMIMSHPPSVVGSERERGWAKSYHVIHFRCLVILSLKVNSSHFVLLPQEFLLSGSIKVVLLTFEGLTLVYQIHTVHGWLYDSVCVLLRSILRLHHSGTCAKRPRTRPNTASSFFVCRIPCFCTGYSGGAVGLGVAIE